MYLTSIKFNKFIYKDIELKALKLKENILSEVKNVSINQLGSMLTIFFTDSSPKNFGDVKKCNFKDFGNFFISLPFFKFIQYFKHNNKARDAS